MQTASELIEQQVPETARRLRVLVVDDSKLQRHILSVSLRKWGYEVLEAEDGAEALALCHESPPDMVLSDWMMPGMDGLEFCRSFRQLERESYGYFILLTAKSEKGAIAEGLDCGADDFLSKPVDPAELRARLSAGQRILGMEAQLKEKNRLIGHALAEIQHLYQALDSDLIQARKLQQSLIPERYKELPGGQIALAVQPASHVGGDLAGFYRIGPQRLGIYAIDVSGHGISSALMTARLAGYLSASAPGQNVGLVRGKDGQYRPRQPADIVSRLNRLVLGEMETEHYFTMILADADLATGKVVLTQAGHPHPVHQTAAGDTLEIGSGGLPVGLFEDAVYDQFELQMHPGDRLWLLSDGVCECQRPDGDFLGEEGTIKLLDSLRGTSGSKALDALMWELSEYTEGGDFRDDVSGVLLEYRGPE